jgi:hypothetical protein
MVQKIAAVLLATKYDVSAALKEIFSSSALFSQQSRFDSVAAPVETFMSFFRALDIPLQRVSYMEGSQAREINPYARLTAAFTATGQNLLSTPTVFGWSEAGKVTGNRIHNGSVWLSSQLILERQRQFTLVLNEISAGVIKAPAVYGNTWKALLPPSVALHRNPEAIVDHLALKLAIPLSVEEKREMVSYLTTLALRRSVSNTSQVDRAYLKTIDWGKLTQAEFDQLWAQKAQGLLEILFAHPMNHIK